MTEIAFHFNAPDKLAYACRLLRKASVGGARVMVLADPAVLRELDTALWTFSALDFVPHGLAGNLAPAQLAHTPIVLAPTTQDAPHRQVLVNLSDQVPEGFESFERLIEVVTGDDADRQCARERWKHYAQRGYALVRHDLQEARA
jgi:DNA polymerase-3 subunit chi